jgi:hypothetical protein
MVPCPPTRMLAWAARSGTPGALSASDVSLKELVNVRSVSPPTARQFHRLCTTTVGNGGGALCVDGSGIVSLLLIPGFEGNVQRDKPSVKSYHQAAGRLYFSYVFSWRYPRPSRPVLKSRACQAQPSPAQHDTPIDRAPGYLVGGSSSSSGGSSGFTASRARSADTGSSGRVTRSSRSSGVGCSCVICVPSYVQAAR